MGFGASEELWLWIHPFLYSKGQFLIYGKFAYSNSRVLRLIVWDSSGAGVKQFLDYSSSLLLI